MKIVHISTSEKIGGAALATNRLNTAYIENNDDSIMLVLNRTTSKEGVYPYMEGKKSLYFKFKQLVLEKMKQVLMSPSYTFSLGWCGYNLHKSKLIKDADIIYIHWIGHNFLSIKGIYKILKLNKPTFIYMHDMWLITGGCHHSFKCNQYKRSCSNCPIIRNKYFKFFANITYKLKKKYLSKQKNLNIIVPSKWMEDCVKKTTLFNTSNIYLIPNLIDTNIFKPTNKEWARNILNLPKNKKLILFGANGGKSDKYKGWDYLVSAISLLNRTDIAIVLFGGYLNSDETKQFNCPVYSLGYLHDEYSAVLMYNAVDVYVTPSLAESFGLTIQESIACGTLAVGFNVGGIPDLIKHKKTGYLARFKDIEDFAIGINWGLDHCNTISREELNLYINKNFSSQVVLDKHKAIINKQPI